MHTQVLLVRPDYPEPEAITRAAAVIRRGGLVAFPTETVYGLGADALNPAAVARIFTAKGRPPHDPLIVHVAEAADLRRVARQVSDLAERLAERFWPGPLTLVVLRADIVPPIVTASGDTVAVRCPAHPVALALIRTAATPIAAPSANRFGGPSPTTAQHVLDDLAGRFDLLLDGGPTPVGVESTVLDLTRRVPTILRPGGVTHEALEAVLGPVAVLERPEKATMPLPSPGLLDRHYAPRAQMWLFTGPRESVLEAMREHAQELVKAGKRVGVLVADEDVATLAGEPVTMQSVGPTANLDLIARNLFAALRALDVQGMDVILARDFGPTGLGLAVRDRLKRAAERVVTLT